MKYVLLTVIFIFLNNCTTPTIKQYKNNKLTINYNNMILIEGKGTEIYTNRLHLPHINIYQYIYNINGNHITYEYAKATDGYKFIKGIKRSVAIIFDTNAYTLEYRKGNLYFFRLKSNRETLYLIVENMNSSALKLVYGLSKLAYDQIRTSVKENKPLSNKKNNKFVKKNTNQISSYIKSKWSPKLIIIDQLVSKPVGRGALGRR